MGVSATSTGICFDGRQRQDRFRPAWPRLSLLRCRGRVAVSSLEWTASLAVWGRFERYPLGNEVTLAIASPLPLTAFAEASPGLVSEHRARHVQAEFWSDSGNVGGLASCLGVVWLKPCHRGGAGNVTLDVGRYRMCQNMSGCLGYVTVYYLRVICVVNSGRYCQQRVNERRVGRPRSGFVVTCRTVCHCTVE